VHWNDMHVEVLEFTTLAVAITHDEPWDKMAYNASRYMMSSLYLNLYQFQLEDGEEVLEHSGLLETHEIQQVLDVSDEGYSPSDMLDIWTLLELHSCPKVKGGELTQLKNKVLRLSKHCRDIKAKMDMPVPHEYYHIVNFMLLVSFIMLAYLLALQESYYGGFLYLSLLIAFLGLRELATDFCDPFGNLPGDFPVERRLAETRAGVNFLLRCEDSDVTRSKFEEEEADRKLCSLMSMFGKPKVPVAAEAENTVTAADKQRQERVEEIKQEEIANVRNVVEELFHRYDLDGSGTVNTQEELQMLALNVSFKLNIHADQDIFRSEDDTLSMSLEEFTQWFYSKVGHKMCSRSPRG